MSPREPRLKPRARIEFEDYPVDAAWSGDGQSLIVAGGDGSVLWLAQSGAPRVVGRHEGGVLAVAAQRAGRLFATAGQDGFVQLWDARTFEAKALHQGTEWSEHLAFCDNGKLLAIASGRTLRVFDERGESRAEFRDHPGSIAAIAWRPKSTEVAATGNGGARVHRIEPQPASRDFPWQGACLTANWNHDGRVLAAGMQDGSVHIWYVAAGNDSQMQGYGSKVLATEWSANGRYLATAAAETLVIWDFGGRGPEGSRPIHLRAHSERISSLRFRPSGTYLVSAARDRRLLLWRVGAGDTPLDAHLLADECTLLRFSADGTRLAVGDARGGLTLFDCEF